MIAASHPLRSVHSRRYRWLPYVNVVMTVLTLAAGWFLLQYVERRLVDATGEQLTLAAAEVSDKLDRLLFERYSDVQMMARAFSLQASDSRYLSEYLAWMKAKYEPVYFWLGVTDSQGTIVATTNASLLGEDESRADWFRRVRATRRVLVQDVAIHETDNGVETVAFTVPILDSQEAFLGVVTARVTVPTLEEVTTRTIRSLEDRAGFVGSVEYQMLTRRGDVFVDSDLLHKAPMNLKLLGLPSALAAQSGVPGFLEEKHLRRHVEVVSGYAQTHGHGDFAGFGWSVLVRMDRQAILAPIQSALWSVGLAAAVVWVPLLVLLLRATAWLRAEYQQAQQESAWARAAEAALLQSQERNRAVVDTALDGVITIDAGGLITDWNAQAEKMFGWSRKEVLGRRLSETIIPARDREAHEGGLHQFLATGESHILNRRVEVLALHRDGHEFPVELAISPARIGEVYFFSAFLRDITEQKEAQGRLRESEARYRSVVNALDEGVVLVDTQGVMRTANTGAERILGLPLDEMVGRSLSDPRWQTVHEDGSPFSSAEHPATITLRMGQPCSGVVMGVCKPDGIRRWIAVNSRALLGSDQQAAAVVVSFTDITERKRTEDRLAAQYAVTRVLSEARTLEEAVPKILQAIGENLEWDFGVFWRVDRSNGVLRCLDQWQSPSLKVDPFPVATWQSVFKPGEGLPGRIWDSGKPAWVTDVTVDTNFTRGKEAQTAGIHGAFGFPVQVGGEIEGVIEIFSRQVREPDADLLKMVEDIALKIGQFGERTRAEEALRQTEDQLRQSQKMEAVGRLAGGVAHDFNNLLTVIRGYSELLLARLASTDPIRKDMEEVKKAADRASGLTRQLLAFSRRQFVAPKVFEMNALVTNMDGMLRRLLGEDIIELCLELKPHVGSIRADPGQIEQVIMNLAVNARDAMPTGGRLTIETETVTLARGGVREVPGLDPGAYVRLTVRDTGHGMDEEIQSHLFEPFFTTKAKGKGTGLGLSTVYGIVKQSGGSITVESRPGKGTTFKIYFPLVEEGPQLTEGVVGASDPARGRETILLVEDEPSVRGLVFEALRLKGYTVLEARHGIEALLTGTKHMGPIHLLLTDVVMPQMSGPEVADKLTIVRPDMKVLFMSGYPDHPVFAQGGLKKATAFLQKPFTPNVLVQKVREVLDGVKVA
jgi:PAS domain S-box-containing protein